MRAALRGVLTPSLISPSSSEGAGSGPDRGEILVHTSQGHRLRRRTDGVPGSGHASSARGGISSQASGCAHASTSGATGSHDDNAGINASATDRHGRSGFTENAGNTILGSSASDAVVRSSVGDNNSIARGPAIRVVPALVSSARGRHNGPGGATPGETAWSIASRLERRPHSGRSEAAWLVACL